MLLVVPDAADVPAATSAASQFLIFQRQRVQATREDEILGVWVTRDLDAGLPAWLSVDAALGIRESLSLSGVWTLCWLDGPLWRRATTSADRRELLLRALAQAVSTPSNSPAECGPFFPVFRADAPPEHVSVALRQLRTRYPHLVGSGWFLDDAVRGIVRAEPPLDVAR